MKRIELKKITGIDLINAIQMVINIQQQTNIELMLYDLMNLDTYDLLNIAQQIEAIILGYTN